MRNLPAILLMLVVVAGCGRSAPRPSPDDIYGRALDVYTSEREELDRLESVALVKSVEFAQLRSAIVTELAVLDDQEKQTGSHKDSVDEIAGNRTELTRGVYSPCDLCRDNPSAPPAWQFKAREIAHDRELKIIEFRDATLELDGWPIFYTPYISAPDPTVKRASGS